MGTTITTTTDDDDDNGDDGNVDDGKEGLGSETAVEVVAACGGPWAEPTALLPTRKLAGKAVASISEGTGLQLRRASTATKDASEAIIDGLEVQVRMIVMTMSCFWRTQRWTAGR